MIMQSLVSFYEVLAKQGKVPREGWANTPVGSVIYLKPDGTIEQIVSIRNEQEKGKPRPQEFQLPSWGSAVGSGVRSNCLYGSAAYVLGLSERDTAKKGRLAQSVENAWQLHHKVLDGIKNPAVEALLLYFDQLQSGERLNEEQTSKLSPTALTGDNFIFSFDGQFIHEIPEVQDAWDKHYQLQDSEKGSARCLVTGDKAPIAVKHPFIKGLRGAQGSGAGLATYNAESFCSYGYEQNLNAPVSRHAAYAYTQALTYLIANPKYSRDFGEGLTIVWWPDSAEEDYGELFLGSLFGGKESSKWTDEDIGEMLSVLSKGRPVGNIDPGRKFSVMGISPNASRIIMRFFRQDTFGAILKNVIAHYDRLELIGNKDGRKLTASRAFRAMVREDVSKELPEPVIRSYFESVLFGRCYPIQMFSLTHRRIQVTTNAKNQKTDSAESAKKKQNAEPSKSAMSWQRTSLIKAYFLQTLSDNDERKKCFAVSLQENNTNPGYLLGRLFAVYEVAQSVGRGGEQWDEAPIHPMFAAAMSTPAAIYPRLARILSVYLPKDKCHQYAKLVEEIKSLLPCEYPKRLDMVGQGAFDLGYYHQRRALSGNKSNDSTDDGAESEE